MKKLICVKDVELILEKNMCELEIDEKTIITPAAKDIIKNHNIKVLLKKEKVEKNSIGNMDMDKVMEFFKVISKDPVLQKSIMKILLNEKKFEIETDKTGFTLIKGDSIKYDKNFKNLNIYSQDLIKTKDNIVGILKIDNDSFVKNTQSDGNLFIVEGDVDIILNGKKYTAKSGDLVSIPKNINLKITSSNASKVLYFSKNLNWSETL